MGIQRGQAWRWSGRDTSGKSRNGDDQGGCPGRGVTEAKVHQGDRPGALGAARDIRHLMRSFLMLDLEAPDMSPSSRTVYLGGPHRRSHNIRPAHNQLALLSQPSDRVTFLPSWSFPHMERNSAPAKRRSGNGNTLTSSPPHTPSPAPGSGVPGVPQGWNQEWG